MLGTDGCQKLQIVNKNRLYLLWVTKTFLLKSCRGTVHRPERRSMSGCVAGSQRLHTSTIVPLQCCRILPAAVHSPAEIPDCMQLTQPEVDARKHALLAIQNAVFYSAVGSTWVPNSSHIQWNRLNHYVFPHVTQVDLAPEQGVNAGVKAPSTTVLAEGTTG